MPGYSWGLSAFKCQTGSILNKIEGTPCSKCYARKGMYRYPCSVDALAKRLEAWQQDPDWVLLMSIRLLLHSNKHKFFRWFDSGDLQSAKMAQDINQVCLNIDPYVQCWMPSQERSYVQSIGNIAPNLTIRISSTKIGEQQTSSIVGVQNSLVLKEERIGVYMCLSSKQDNKCGPCRACWDKSITHVGYKQH